MEALQAANVDLRREHMLADLGELAGPLVHEFNNLLNSLTLHLALWEQIQPGLQHDDLSEMRKHIKQVVSLAAQFQQRRRSLFPESNSCTLDELVQAEIKDLEQQSAGESPVSVRMELTANGARVGMPPVDVRRLCRFLLQNARRGAAAGGGEVVVRTLKRGDAVGLVVEDNGPDVPAALLVRAFDPTFHIREGHVGLELASCYAIVGRANGKITASGRAGGGLEISVNLVAPKEVDHR